LITDFFGKTTPIRCTEPDEAVVKGATIYSGMLSEGGSSN